MFQVRSGSTTDPVRNYTVEAGKTLSGSWTVSGSYDLSVYGPNGFMRYFKGSVGLAPWRSMSVPNMETTTKPRSPFRAECRLAESQRDRA